MKNRVNISKLIEEKYAEKDDTFSLEQLNEMIDSFLDESDQSSHTSKVVRNGVSDSIPENQESVNIFNRMFGAQGVRNQAGPEQPINADKIAENTSQNVSEQVTLEIPDIFSLITNSQMTLEDDDRVMINGIIATLKGKNWIERLQNLSNYLEQSSGEFNEIPQGGIREAVSSLITLSLLKRISYSIEQPGKLFEYIIAPVIGSDAEVVSSGESPSEAKSDIVDVNRTDAKKPYSIKFFTGATSAMEMIGSRASLEQKIKERNGLPLTYIAARANKQDGTIKFYEFLLSTNANSFNSDKWGKIKDAEHGAYFKFTKGGVGSQYAIWVNSIAGEKFEDALSKLGQQSNVKSDVKIKTRSQRSGEINVFNYPVKLKQKGTLSDFLNPLNARLQILKSNLIKQNPDKESEISELINDFVTKIKDAFTKEMQIHKGTNDFFFDAMKERMTNLNLDLKKSLQNLQINDNQSSSSAPEQQNTSSSDIPINEEQIQSTQFSIPILSLENEAARFTLKLGNPKNIQAFELKMGGNLVRNMKTVFEEFRKLNKNIINFFSITDTARQKVAKDPSKVTSSSSYGEQAKQNAEKIASNINEFMTNEK